MNKLLELGEIGLLQDIPAEIDFLTKENQLLKATNVRQKSQLRFLGFVLAAIGVYLIWKDLKKRRMEKTEDENLNT